MKSLWRGRTLAVLTLFLIAALVWPAVYAQAEGEETVEYKRTLVVSDEAGETFPTIQAALGSLPKSECGDVLLLVNKDVPPKVRNEEILLPRDKGITSLTIGTNIDGGVTIGGDYKDCYLYANGIPLVIDKGITLDTYLTLFGGSTEDIASGGTSITVNAGAKASTVYGGGRGSDVTGNVFIQVQGIVRTVYGGGFAYAYTDTGDLTTTADVDGDIGITVSGDSSQVTMVVGGGRVYVSSSKEAAQTLQANVLGNIAIDLDCPNMGSDSEVYGGGYAQISTTDATKMDNRQLKANVGGDINVTLSGDTNGNEDDSWSQYLNLWGGGYSKTGINGSRTDVVLNNTLVEASVAGSTKIDASLDAHATSGANDWDSSMFDYLYGGGKASGRYAKAWVGKDTSIVTSRKGRGNDRDLGVFGGGHATQGGSARVKGSTYVEVVRAQTQASGHENAKSVFGGGCSGTFGDATVEQDTHVVIESGISFEPGGMGIVGGGRAFETSATADVLGSATVEVKNGANLKSSRLIGGGMAVAENCSANVKGRVTTRLTGEFTSTSHMIGGGYAIGANSKAIVGSLDQADSISTVIQGEGASFQLSSYYYGAGYATGAGADASVQGGVSVTFDGVKYTGATLWMYIGGYATTGQKADVSGSIQVHVTNQSSLSSCVVRPAGSNSKVGGTIRLLLDKNSYCDTVYGGGANAQVQNSEIQITNARALNVYGGGYGEDSNVENVKIAVTDAEITGVLYGGGYKGPVQDTAIHTSNSTINYIYGGSYISSAKNVEICLEDSRTSWIYPAGYQSTVQEDAVLQLLGDTEIAGSYISAKESATIDGRFRILVGDDEKETKAVSNSNLYYDKDSYVSIAEKAVLTGTNSEYDLLWNVQNLDIAQTGRLVLAKGQVIPGELSGSGTIELPAKNTLTIWGALTGTITLERPEAAAGQRLAFSKKNASPGTFAANIPGFTLNRTEVESDNEYYYWVLGQSSSFSVTAESNDESMGTVAPETQEVSPGGTAKITVTRTPGYKVDKITVNGEVVSDPDLSADTVTIENIAQNTHVLVTFCKMTAGDVADSTGSLPEIGPGDTVDDPEEKETILDTKQDYEALDDEEKKNLPDEPKDKLNEALNALPEVDVEVEVKGGGAVALDLPNLPTLLENMTQEEAANLKQGTVTKYKIVVTVEKVEDTGDAADSIMESLDGALQAGHHDVAVKKFVTKTAGSNPEEAELNELKRPIRLTFEIPEDLRTAPSGFQRRFSMLRTHKEADDSYTTISLRDMDSAPETYTVESDQFSLYTLAYTDSINSGDSGETDVFPFRDVKEADWFYDAVAYVYEHGLMEGTSPTVFAPRLSTTRGMVVTILYRLEGSPETSAPDFDDVGSGQYYTDAVGWASSKNIVLGYGNGNFGPMDWVTREQLAAILYRYAGYKGWDVSGAASLESFTDSGRASGYAREALEWAVDAEILRGYGNALLNPRGNATRAEVAQMLLRFCESFRVY